MTRFAKLCEEDIFALPAHTSAEKDLLPEPKVTLQLGLEAVESPPERGEGKCWQRRAHIKVFVSVGVHLTAFPFYTKPFPNQNHPNKTPQQYRL